MTIKCKGRTGSVLGNAVVVNRAAWGKGPAKALLTGVLAASLSATVMAPARTDAFSEKSDDFLSRQYSAAKTSGWASVIVKFAGEPTPANMAEIRALGGDVYRSLPIIQSAAIRVPVRNMRKLASLKFVIRLSADATVKKCDEFTRGSSKADAAVQQYGLSGNGVRVAVIDSGVRSNKDLKDLVDNDNRIVGRASFVQDGYGNSDMCGHGTHVAGIIAGNGKMSTGSSYFRTFYGVAQRADIVSIRVLDKTGQGTVSQVISGIQWAITNKTLYRIKVMNLSFGHPVGESYKTDPLCQSVEAAWKAGIVVVCAAGNGGRANADSAPGRDNEGFGTAWGSIQSPANDPYVITVGAAKQRGGGRGNDTIATYSARGPSRLDFVLKPDLVAPGNRVISLNVPSSYIDVTYGDLANVDLNEYKYTSSDLPSEKYARLSGTSMAAPVVAGAAALMLEKDPTLTPDTIKARLMMTADKWLDQNGLPSPCTYGAGYVNVQAALGCKSVASKSAMSPSLYRDALGNVLIDKTNVMWGSQIIWGTDVVWGVEEAPNFQVIWGTGVIWGTQIIWGSDVLSGIPTWTDQVIWGTNSSAADLGMTTLKGED